MYGFGICEIPAILQVIRFIKILINLVKFIVPIGLIIMISLDFGKGVISGDKKPGEILKSCSNRIIAAVVIFLVPTIVSFALGLVDGMTSYESCWVNAEISMIDKYQLLWDEEIAKKEEEERQRLQEIRKKEEEEAKKKEEESKQEIVNEFSSGSTDNSNSGYSRKIISINTTDLGCALYYDISKKNSLKSLSIQEGEADNLHSALVGACSYVKSLGYDYIQTAGTYVKGTGEHDYHAKGLAIDLNNMWSYVSKDGVIYKPYADQGYGTWNNYKKFICEVCNGKENCKYNINYIIYIKYFKEHGWCWGGNWSPEWFDPMHFEKRTGGCSVLNKKEITCD